MFKAIKVFSKVPQILRKRTQEKTAHRTECMGTSVITPEPRNEIRQAVLTKHPYSF